jgi:hypothetical protein
MAYDIQTGTVNHGIRKEVIDSMVKQTAERSYKFKQACAVVPTDAWKTTFFREDPTILSGQSGNSINGIPRGANFPQMTVKWEEVTARIVKYGAEDNIPWEDLISGDIAVQSRIIIKLTEGVVKAVDDAIWNSLTQTLNTETPLRISSYAIAATGKFWNSASAAIIEDLMNASRIIAEKNYDTNDLICFVSPADKVAIMSYLAAKGAQFPSIATSVAENGKLGTLAGIQLVVSNSVSASYALVVKPKTAATWKELVSLRSTTVEDPYRSLKIRVVEEGICMLTDPAAICLIKGTKMVVP